MYCTVEEVIQLTNIKPTSFQLKKDDDEGLEKILTEWIHTAENIIETYCKRKFTNPPLAISNVCLRLVSNMIVFMMLRKDSPIIQVNDFKHEVSSSEIFTDDLKNDLKRFKKTTPVAVFSI